MLTKGSRGWGGEMAIDIAKVVRFLRIAMGDVERLYEEAECAAEDLDDDCLREDIDRHRHNAQAWIMHAIDVLEAGDGE